MFDVGFSELILLAIVALVVLGPEKLPHAARILGAWVGRIRRTVTQIQSEIEREVSAQEMKAQMEKEFGHLKGNNILNELQAEQQKINEELKNISVAATGSLASASTVEATATETVTPLPVGDEPPPPVLPDAAETPAEVKLDGEAAYREWLEAQRRDVINRANANKTGNPST